MLCETAQNKSQLLFFRPEDDRCVRCSDQKCVQIAQQAPCRPAQRRICHPSRWDAPQWPQSGRKRFQWRTCENTRLHRHVLFKNLWWVSVADCRLAWCVNLPAHAVVIKWMASNAAPDCHCRQIAGSTADGALRRADGPRDAQGLEYTYKCPRS